MLHTWLAPALLLFAAAAAQSPAPLQPLARSAQLAVDATAVPGGLALRVHRAAGPAPLAVSDVTVSIGGRSQPAEARPDGSWFVPRPADARDAGAALAVTVGHDGIHEVLSGRLAGAAAPAAPAPRAQSAGRGQLAWWALNIVIVLIAAIAISRRMS